MNIIGKRFTPEAFRVYCEGLQWTGWKPSFVVLHNTSEPSLAQRPHGFTEQHMANLKSYYEGLGWHGGPHLFIDQNGIWVFNPLTQRGTHSPSWNAVSLGVEMLGEYEDEAFDSGPGALVRGNAVAALAVLHHRLGLDSHTMRLHKEDPATTHKECPGRNVDKADVIERVHDAILALK